MKLKPNIEQLLFFYPAAEQILNRSLFHAYKTISQSLKKVKFRNDACARAKTCTGITISVEETFPPN